MKTVVNPTAQAIVVPWCIVPVHWSGGQHQVWSSVQSDAFEGFETALPEVVNTVIIPPGSSLTFDNLQPNGVAIDAALLAGGMST